VPDLPSGSKLSLAVKCLGSNLLPQVKDEPGEAAIAGTETHAKLEKYIEGGRKEPQDSSDSDRDLYRRVHATTIRADTISESAESLISVDAIRGVASVHDSAELGSIDRSERFIAFADLIQWNSDYEFSVWDWKTGGFAPSPEWNWQLILPGLCMYIMSGRDPRFRCTLAILYTGQPTDDGKFKTDSATFGGDFFAKCESKLGFIQKQLKSSDPSTLKLYEGKHCGYCPARARCPAKAGALLSAMGIIAEMNGENEILDEDIVKASRFLIDNKPQLDKAEKEILNRHGGQLNLGDGRIAVLEKKTSEKTGKTTEKVYTKHATKA